MQDLKNNWISVLPQLPNNFYYEVSEIVEEMTPGTTGMTFNGSYVDGVGFHYANSGTTKGLLSGLQKLNPAGGVCIKRPSFDKTDYEASATLGDFIQSIQGSGVVLSATNAEEMYTAGNGVFRFIFEYTVKRFGSSTRTMLEVDGL